MKLTKEFIKKTGRKKIFVLILLSIISSFVFCGTLIFREKLVDSIIQTEIDAELIVTILLVMMFLKYFEKVIKHLQDIMYNKIQLSSKKDINAVILERISNLKYKYFESKDELNLLNRSFIDFDERFSNYLIGLSKLLINILSIILLMIIISRVNVIIALLNLIMLIPIITVSIVNGMRYKIFGVRLLPKEESLSTIKKF